jgi:hypothetical protein
MIASMFCAMSSAVSGDFEIPGVCTTAILDTPPMPICKTSPFSRQDSCARNATAGLDNACRRRLFGNRRMTRDGLTAASGAGNHNDAAVEA